MHGRLDDFSTFLLQLYRDARRVEPDIFQRSVLRRLQTLVPFDFVAWGGGEAAERQVTQVTVLNQDQRVLTEWPEVGPWDQFCDLTLQRMNRTWHFDDIPGYRNTLAYNEHWRNFDISHMMATIMCEPMDGYVSFVGLFHEDMARPFSEDERALVQLLMPHLAEALRVNCQWTVTAAESKADATAMIDSAGRILASRGALTELMREEWGKNPGDRVPEVLVEASRQDTAWRGRRIQVHTRAFGHNRLLRVQLLPPLSSLPSRASEVAQLFGEGLSHKEVARELGLSPETVRKHLAYVYKALGIHRKAELSRLVSGSKQS